MTFRGGGYNFFVNMVVEDHLGLSKDIKTEYYLNDELDLNGAKLVLSLMIILKAKWQLLMIWLQVLTHQ